MEQREITAKYMVCSINELGDLLRKAVEEARAATAGSYSPYSHFKVGAVAVLDDGTMVRGANQENVAFPSGLCAERTALFAAGAQYPDLGVSMLCIAARDEKGEFTEEPVTPCGACRQVMAQTEQRSGHPLVVVLSGKDKVYVFNSAADLLPLSFELPAGPG